MSYVHDIHLDLDYDRNAFAAAVEDIRTLFGRSDLPVVGPSSRPGSQPLLDDDFIGSMKSTTLANVILGTLITMVCRAVHIPTVGLPPSSTPSVSHS